jgi:ABC-2 type transport system permease protein
VRLVERRNDVRAACRRQAIAKTTGLFDRDLLQTGKSEVQVVVDGINAYSSGLAKGYVSQITTRFNLDLLERYQPVSTAPEVPVQAEITLRYNPGMLDSWFFVPGVLGTIMTVKRSRATGVWCQTELGATG